MNHSVRSGIDNLTLLDMRKENMLILYFIEDPINLLGVEYIELDDFRWADTIQSSPDGFPSLIAEYFLYLASE